MSDIIFNLVSYFIEFARVLFISIYLIQIKVDYKKKLFIGFIISLLLVGIASHYVFLYDISFVFDIVALILLFISTSEKKKNKNKHYSKYRYNYI